MDKNQTLSLLHSIDTEYCIKKKEATMRIIEARHALREKSSDREKAEDDLQNALDAYSLINLEHQAERSKAWAGMDREEADAPAVPVVVETPRPDGVYFIFTDGSSFLYKGLNGEVKSYPGDQLKMTVAYIGIKMGETKVAVSLGEEAGTLVKKDAKVLDEEPSYCSNWEQARLFHLNGKEDTDYIIKQGTDIELSDGEYIPSLFELQIIFLFRKWVDEALDIVEGELLKDDWYWSSTSRSANYAWFLTFGDGGQYDGIKSTFRRRVRPVSAIIW